MTKPLATLLLLLALSAAPALAHDAGEEDPHPTAHHANRHLALFFGRASAGGHANLALGADLEYRLPVLHRAVGVSALIDAAFTEHTHVFAGAGIVAHPVKGLRLLLAPGVASEHGHRAFAFRPGIGYDVHVGRFALTPTLNLDVADGHVAQVVGLSFGAGF